MISHTPIPITVPSTRTATAKFGMNGFGVLAIGHTILSIIVIATWATGIRTYYQIYFSFRVISSQLNDEFSKNYF